jgi:hypothetical protein
MHHDRGDLLHIIDFSDRAVIVLLAFPEFTTPLGSEKNKKQKYF